MNHIHGAYGLISAHGAPERAVKRMRSNPSALWRVIYIARGEQQAQSIVDLLREAGFLVDRKCLDARTAQTEDIEIKVLDAEAKEARLYLMEQGY